MFGQPFWIAFTPGQLQKKRIQLAKDGLGHGWSAEIKWRGAIIKPEISKVFENRFWPVHIKEHTQKSIFHLRNMCGIMDFEILSWHRVYHSYTDVFYSFTKMRRRESF